MSNKRVIAGVLGAIIGFFAGGPFGAIQGFSTGYTLAAAFEKPDLPPGPRLEELEFNDSKYGVGIPRIYGTDISNANIFWMKDNKLDEIRVSSGYEYYATFAVAVAQGPISRIRKIWANDEVIYEYVDPSDKTRSIIDALRDFFDKTKAVLDTLKEVVLDPFSLLGTDPKTIIGSIGERIQANLEGQNIELTIYRGDFTQQPDPTIQDEKGAETPAYRGVAYVVFKNMKLTNENFRNSIPKIKFLVEVNKEMVEVTTQSFQNDEQTELQLNPYLEETLFVDETDTEVESSFYGLRSTLGSIQPNKELDLDYYKPTSSPRVDNTDARVNQIVKFDEQTNTVSQMCMFTELVSGTHKVQSSFVVGELFVNTALYNINETWVIRRKFSMDSETVDYSNASNYEHNLLSEEVFRLNMMALPPTVLTGLETLLTAGYNPEVTVCPIMNTDEYVLVNYKAFRANVGLPTYTLGIGKLSAGEIIVTAITLPDEVYSYSGEDYLTSLYTGGTFTVGRMATTVIAGAASENDQASRASLLKAVYDPASRYFYLYCNAPVTKENALPASTLLRTKAGGFFPGVIAISEGAIGNRKPFLRSDKQPVFPFKPAGGYSDNNTAIINSFFEREVYLVSNFHYWAQEAVLHPKYVKYFPKLALTGMTFDQKTGGKQLLIHTIVPDVSATYTPPVGQSAYAIWTNTAIWDIPDVSSVPVNAMWVMNPYAATTITNNDLIKIYEADRELTPLVIDASSLTYFKGWGLSWTVGKIVFNVDTNTSSKRWLYLNDNLIDLTPQAQDVTKRGASLVYPGLSSYPFGNSEDYIVFKENEATAIGMLADIKFSMRKTFADTTVWAFAGLGERTAFPQGANKVKYTTIIFPITQTEYDNRSLTIDAREIAEAVTVEDYLNLEMASVNLLTTNDYDFSDTTDTIMGMNIADRAPIKNTLQALQDAFLFDIREEDYKIVSKKRSTSSVVANIPESDLGVHEVGQMPVIISPTVVSKYDKPSQLTLQYKSPTLDYGVDTIQLTDPTIEHYNSVEFKVPLVLNPTDAYRILDQYSQQLDSTYRGSVEIQTSFKYSHLEPGDFIQVTLDSGTIYPMRIVSLDKGRPGIVKIRGVIDYPEAYQSDKNGFGTDNNETESILRNSSRALTVMSAETWPLTEDQRGAGSFLFASYNRNAYLDDADDADDIRLSFRYRTSFENKFVSGLGTISPIAKYELPTIYTTGDIDYRGSISFFPSGTDPYTSVTEDELFESRLVNTYLMGSPGAGWEMVKILNFDEDPDTGLITASGFLRGYNGTSVFQAPSSTPNGLYLISFDVAGFFGTYHQPEMLKPSPYGVGFEPSGFYLTTFQPDNRYNSGDYVNFRTVCLTPQPPVHLEGDYSPSDSGYVLSWVRQSRYDNEWSNESNAPLDQQYEAYTVYFYDADGVFVAKRDVIDSNTMVYLDTEQVEDFGSAQDTIYWSVAQQSPEYGVTGYQSPAITTEK